MDSKELIPILEAAVKWLDWGPDNKWISKNGAESYDIVRAGAEAMQQVLDGLKAGHTLEHALHEMSHDIQYYQNMPRKAVSQITYALVMGLKLGK